MAPLLDGMLGPLHCVPRVVGTATAVALPQGTQPELDAFFIGANWRNRMTEWHKPEVTEQEVGLEVTTYLPAELDND
jgi:coenzyme PQQ precursor peptide PqqA